MSGWQINYPEVDAVYGAERSETQDAIELLVDLYDAWGKPQHAAEWRAKLAEKEEEPGLE